jgi:hypothetical protein
MDFITEIYQEWVNRIDNNPDLTNPKHFVILSEILHERDLPLKWIDEFKSNLTDYIKGDQL